VTKHIALVGPAGAGKTTIANALTGYHRRALADPLKSMLSAWLGRPLDKAKDRRRLQFLGTEVGRNPAFTYVGQAKTRAERDLAAAQLSAHLRQYIPELGMAGWPSFAVDQATLRLADELYDPMGVGPDRAEGFGRPDYWVDLFIREMWHDLYVVDDCRFVNEAAKLHAAGFVIVKVDVPADVRSRRLAARDGVATTPQHVSETEWEAIEPDLTITAEAGDPAITAAALLAAVGKLAA